MRRGRLRDVQVDDAGLHDRNPILGIDGENAVHPLHLDDDSAFHRHRAAAQAGSRAARKKRKAIFIRNANDLRDLFGGLRKNNSVRLVFEKRESVAFVDEELGFIVSNAPERRVSVEVCL